jgi:hypothetical protein
MLFLVWMEQLVTDNVVIDTPSPYQLVNAQKWPNVAPSLP